MKKKFREITVGDKTYGWTIKKGNDGDGNHPKNLSIWLNKKVIHEQEMDDEEITPATVKKIIERKKL